MFRTWHKLCPVTIRYTAKEVAMMKKRFLFCLVAGLATAPVFAAEQEPSESLLKTGSFNDVDQNQDGVLTPEEFNSGFQHYRQYRQSKWASMGRNRNFGTGRGFHMPRFHDFDLNQDGFIEEVELTQARNQRINQRAQQGYRMRNLGNMPAFQDIDSDADGKISPQEFATHQEQHRLQRGMR